MPTLPDYRIPDTPGLPYGSPNLPDKIELWAFLCFNLEFIPFSPQIRIFYDSKFGFWGIFARISSLTKSWKLIVMVCNSCKTSYNVLSQLRTGSNCAYGGRGQGGWSLIFGGLMQKKQSPDFRFPEVGISVIWTDQICSGVSVGAVNTLKSEKKNRQESDKRNSSVNHLATSGFSRDVSLCWKTLSLPCQLRHIKAWVTS